MDTHIYTHHTHIHAPADFVHFLNLVIKLSTVFQQRLQQHRLVLSGGRAYRAAQRGSLQRGCLQ